MTALTAPFIRTLYGFVAVLYFPIRQAWESCFNDVRGGSVMTAKPVRDEA